jgi:uncharacterized protein (TIGR02391 family)
MTPNLQLRLDHRLWAAIENAYQGGNYTSAILDSIHFLGELIREKTGLEGDGVPLVGQAFGGSNPKLKVTKCQTESEKNVQSGIEQFVRGIYQGIRNPRSHEKYSDSVEDADALILFINYLVTVIDKGKGPFDKEVFLEQVFDPYFPEDDNYAALLVDRIPTRKRWDVLLEVYRRKREGSGSTLSFFFRALLDTLSAEDLDAFCAVVSEELETITDDATIIAVIGILPPENWGKYTEVARIRIESKLIEAIKKGTYDRSARTCLSGGFGTWGSDLRSRFVLKDRLLVVLENKLLASDSQAQDYVLKYFFPQARTDFPDAPPMLVSSLVQGLNKGDARFHDALSFVTILEETDPWSLALKESYDAFQDANPLPKLPD